MKNVALCAGFSLLAAGASCALAGERARIVIDDLDFKPSTITVRVGDTVEWINKDIVEHTATAKSGAFDVATPKGRPARIRISAAGTIDYYCRLHPNMTGVIRVLP